MKPSVAGSLPPALAAAREISPAVYILELGGAARLALNPDEVAPLIGQSVQQVQKLCRDGVLPAQNLYPGSRNGRYSILVGELIEWYRTRRDDPIPTAS